MWFHNIHYFAGDEGCVYGSICIEDGVFTEVRREDAKNQNCKSQDIKYKDNKNKGCKNEDSNNQIEHEAAYILPGLVDIHVHGAAGYDFSDGCKAGLSGMAEYLLKQGITSFMPTSMTLPYQVLEKAFQTASDLIRDDSPAAGARILGIHMEGPFLSEKKCGAQNPAYLKNPDIDAFNRLQEGCGKLIRLVDLAPELEGAVEFAEQAADTCRISAGHTDADYEQARRFYQAGARHLTHLFNAMPSIHHRSPGVIGAASEREDVTAELIADGYHVHPSAVRMAFKLFPGRICLISDGLRCMGMPDGDYELGGQTVRLKGGAARLADGTLAGAASNLFTDMKNAISFGIPINEAIKAATINPARAAGWDDRIGSIEKGKIADCIVCDSNLNLRKVIHQGILVQPES